MNSMAIGGIVFVCVFGGALLGLYLRTLLPQHHLNAESREAVKLGTGLIGTMAALVLGLLVASAKSSYDTTKGELTQLAANVALLDRILAHYGPQAADAREHLRGMANHAVERLWTEGSSTTTQSGPTTSEGEMLFEKIQQLSPANDSQREIRSQAQSICIDMGRTRMLLFAQRGSSILVPLLVVLVFWESAVFVSLGLFAPRNASVVVTLLVCAFSVASAMYLMLEFDHPFSGLIQISSDPLRAAMAHIGQ